MTLYNYSYTDPAGADSDRIAMEAAKAELAEDFRIKQAFNAWFKMTPEGKLEGVWDNKVYWQWAAAGSPEKIDLGVHPARPALLKAFRAEWLERAATDKPMTMVLPPAPAKRYSFSKR